MVSIMFIIPTKYIIIKHNRKEVVNMNSQINYELIGNLVRSNRSSDRLKSVKSKIEQLSYARFYTNMIEEISEHKGNLNIVWKDDISAFILRNEIEELWRSCSECWIHHYIGDFSRHYFTTLDGERVENPF